MLIRLIRFKTYGLSLQTVQLKHPKQDFDHLRSVSAQYIQQTK